MRFPGRGCKTTNYDDHQSNSGSTGYSSASSFQGGSREFQAGSNEFQDVPSFMSHSSQRRSMLRRGSSWARISADGQVQGSISSSAPSSAVVLSPRARKKNDLSELTIDKLNYKNLGVYGREDEVAILESCWNEVLRGEMKRQLLMISGFSGTGKTVLAETLRSKVTRQNGLYVRGKYDLNLRNQPYSGVASASAEICGAIVDLQKKEPEMAKTICRKIKDNLGSELRLLIQVIPVLEEVFDDELLQSQSSSARCHGSGASHSATSKHKLLFAFLRFMRVISQCFDPLVIVLDDLHWADACSLDLLEALMIDQENTKLMLIGIYRSNDVDEKHIFYRSLEALKARSEENDFQMTCLTIGNLDDDAIHSIIKALLSSDNDPRTLSLAQLCQRKTQGNAFFLIHFLTVLHEDGLLQYNFGTLSWTWNEEEIEAGTSASDNVLDFLMAKMSELPSDLIAVLKLASCLGSTFDLRMLHTLWMGTRGASGKQEDGRGLENIVSKLLEENYLFKLSGFVEQYGWEHDKVHEAAIALIPEDERNEFQYQVGETLVSLLDDGDLDSVIFVAVSLLNAGDLIDPERQLDLAVLNCRASRVAISVSAFESAAEYVRKAMELLPDDAWKQQSKLMLQLHVIGAKSEAYMGNIDKMETYCRDTISREDIPIDDKLEIYNTWADSMVNMGEAENARDLLLEILSKFKCRFPKNPALISIVLARNILEIKATMRTRNVSLLKDMKNATTIELMQLLDKLATCLYLIGDPRMPLVVFRSLHWTMQLGYSEKSPAAFATTGMMLTGMLNDIKGGSLYGQKALNLLEKIQSKATSARVMFIAYTFLFSWTRPMRQLLKPALAAYDEGMQSGDTESAAWAIYFWLCLRLMLGDPLESLESDALMYSKQMKDLKRDQAYFSCRTYRQACLNLMGKDNANERTKLIGEAFNQQDRNFCIENSFLRSGVIGFEALILSYFGNLEQVAKQTIKNGHDFWAKTSVSNPNIMWDACLRGVSCFATARKKRKRKYSRVGYILLKKVKDWLEMGNPNVKQHTVLLSAEEAAYKRKGKKAVRLYEMAILLSARGGYQHDAAFASERLAEFHLSENKDEDEAAYRIGEAINYWSGWGAKGKVDALKEKHDALLNRSMLKKQCPRDIHFAQGTATSDK